MPRKTITNKQHTILTLLLTFRFLNSKQVQEFLSHKDHKRINAWLKDLVEKGYIERDFKPVFGTLTKPAVFNLSSEGRKHMKQSYAYYFPKYLKRISRDNNVSKGFRIKCQIIADWYLTLFPGEHKKGIAVVDSLLKILTTGKDEGEENMPFNTLEFFTPSYFPSFVLLDKIKPDAYIRIKTKAGISHGLLFVIDAYVPRLMLQYLLKKIFTVLEEIYWEDDAIDTLQVYILCPNNMVIIYLQRIIKSFFQKYYGGKELIFKFATRNQLYKRKQTGSGDTGFISISSNAAAY